MGGIGKQCQRIGNPTAEQLNNGKQQRQDKGCIQLMVCVFMVMRVSMSMIVPVMVAGHQQRSPVKIVMHEIIRGAASISTTDYAWLKQKKATRESGLSIIHITYQKME